MCESFFDSSLKSTFNQDFWPTWRHRYIPFASSHNQEKDNNKFKNKINNQNCQKIELYGSPTTKELKKKHSYRPVGGAETGSWVERARSKASAGGWRSHICVQINWEEQLGNETDLTTQGSSAGK